jgi:hypothetical protein
MSKKKRVPKIVMGDGSTIELVGSDDDSLESTESQEVEAMLADMNREMGLPDDEDWGNK